MRSVVPPRSVLTPAPTADLPPGLYVHVPFCAKRCDYCDFVTYADRDELIDDYIDALCTHLERDASHYASTTFGSVFIGGGTPTYIAAPLLQRLCDTITTNYRLSDTVEWTVEANPETVTEEIAGVLAGAGPNRVSLGAQSFDPDVLQILGRWHNPDSVGQAVELLRAVGPAEQGLELSVDLIFGTPGETEASWEQSLTTAISLGVGHLSAYALTVESNTPYARRVRHNHALAPNEDIQADRMATADAMLTAAGLTRYEISNWATAGRQSRHNLLYWRGGQWAAFGCGAHGSWDYLNASHSNQNDSWRTQFSKLNAAHSNTQHSNRRWWLIRDPGKYIRTVAAGEEPVAGEEWPTATEQRLERLMMGLRILDGIPREEVEPLDENVLGQLVGRGWIYVDEHTIALAPAGFRMADAIIRSLA